MMQNSIWKLLTISFILMMMLYGCRTETSDHTIGEVDVHALQDSLKVHPDLMLVDVRSEPEWEAMRVPGVKQFILFDGFDQHCSEINADKDAPIYFICRTGRRSEIAARHMAGLGFTHAINVQGGTMAWAQAGLPLDSGPLPTSESDSQPNSH